MDEQIPALTDREILVRIDAKLDGVIAEKKDHEERIRGIEGKIPYFVTGKQLWAGLASAVAVAGAAFPLIQWVVNK